MQRIPEGKNQCPQCQGDDDESATAPATFIDEVCNIEMIHVPGGIFEMGDLHGDGIDNELPVHKVSLDEFYIGRCPVTQAQWMCLNPHNPSRFEGADLPVEQVTWDDARDFAEKLTRAHNGRCRFGLPTEGQWEFSARSGGRRELYAGGGTIDARGWYEANSGGRTHAVGAKAPNGLGLYDMSGNVWEWCRDTYAPDAYERHTQANPVLDDAGSDRVIRGGSWNLDAWSARCCRRFSLRADLFGAGLGFRLVMVDWPNKRYA